MNTRTEAGTSRAAQQDDALPQLALWPVLTVAAIVAVVLLALSGRYGYHRDELYFLATSHHLAWGYPDQPPFVPALTRVVTAVFGTSPTALRVPSAIAVAAVVVLTATTARELRGERGAQILAAACMAFTPILLGGGHLLETSTFDLLAWTLVIWMTVRMLRTGDTRWWLAIGLATGIALLNNDLVAYLAVGTLAGIAVAGPREVLRSRWLPAGAIIAGACWTPYLLWQARHGWPQLTVARAIAGGSSASSTPRGLFIPDQVLFHGAALALIWILGLLRLLRDPQLRRYRCLGWAYLILAVVLIAAGGKAYYLSGLYPLLFAAGARPVTSRARRIRLGVAFAASALAIPIVLPVIPAADLNSTGIGAVNPEAGEQVAWPTYVDQIAAAYRSLPARQQAGAIVLTRNYGEAGAVDLFGPARGLRTVYSVHNGYWYWGPPPRSATTVVAVGFRQADLVKIFASCRQAATLDNGLHLKNNEQGQPVTLCTGPLRSWAQLWPTMRLLA